MTAPDQPFKNLFVNLQMHKTSFHVKCYQFLCYLSYPLSTGFENAITESISVHRNRHILLNTVEMDAFYAQRWVFFLISGADFFLEVVY